MKIGFFDSGLGGILILKAVTELLPQYDYEYYGDTKNLPYGDKPEEEIYQLTKDGVAALFAKDCLLVILACNTASAQTLRRLQDEWLPTMYPDRRILGVIIPMIEELSISNRTNALLVATKRTVESGKYEIELQKKLVKKLKLTSVATPELVPLIEAGKLEEASEQLLNLILTTEQAVGEIDGVVLGCTHYGLLRPFLRQSIRRPSVTVFSQIEIIPKKLQKYLVRHPEINSRLTKQKQRNIYLTEHKPTYDQYLRDWLTGSSI